MLCHAVLCNARCYVHYPEDLGDLAQQAFTHDVSAWPFWFAQESKIRSDMVQALWGQGAVCPCCVCFAVLSVAAQVAEIRGDLVQASWGQQIRNYVFHPYKLVKDTRTGMEDGAGKLAGGWVGCTVGVC